MSGKTPKHLRKWGPPWGGSWVPWAARGDAADRLSRQGALEGAAAAPDAGATAAAAAVAAAAALAAVGTSPTIGAPAGDAAEGEGEGDGGAEAQDDPGSETETGDGQRVGRGAAVKEGRWLPTELARFVTHLEDSLHKDGRSERPGARSGAATRAESCVVRGRRARGPGGAGDSSDFVVGACLPRA